MIVPGGMRHLSKADAMRLKNREGAAYFVQTRQLYGMKQPEFGRLLGFTGPDSSIARRVRRYEGGEARVRGPLLKLLEILRLARG